MSSVVIYYILYYNIVCFNSTMTVHTNMTLCVVVVLATGALGDCGAYKLEEVHAYVHLTMML